MAPNRRPRRRAASDFSSAEPLAAPPAAAAATDGVVLDGLMATVPGAVVITDAAGVVVRLNGAAREMNPALSLGVRANELIRVTPLFEPDGVTRVAADDFPLLRALRGETVPPTRYTIVRPGQRPRAISASARPLWDGGRLVGVVTVTQDVTWHQNAETRFRAIFEQSAGAIALLDADGRFIATNPALRRMLAYAEAELAAMTTADVVHPADYVHELALRRRLFAREIDSYEVEQRVRRKDGRLRHVSKVVSRLAGLVGEGDMLICMAQDVTARVEAEQALAGSEARLLTLVERSPAIVAIIDLDFRYQYVNRLPDGFEGELIGTCALAPFPPAEVTMAERTRDEIVATRQARRLQVQAPDALGGARWYDVALCPIVEGDVVVALLALAVDITAQHEAQQQVARNQALLAEAERAARFGSWRLHLGTGEVAWSEGMYRLLGYEQGEVEPSIEAYAARLHPDQRASLVRSEAAIRAGEFPFPGDRVIVRPDGEQRVLRLAGHVERDASGEPVAIVGVARDVTDEVNAEREKSDFLTVVSHEMRTPLTLIRAPLLMLGRGELDPRAPSGKMLLELAVQGIERITRLIDDIHDLHRLESGRVAIRPAPVAGRKLVEAATEMLRPFADEGGVRLEIEAADVRVFADADRATQVLANLLENAVKYSPPRGTVRVGLEPRDGMALFTVSDEGPGIPLAQRDAIFGRYVQLGTRCTRPSSGIGLGLAIARDLVALQGGRIWVEPRPGGGSIFCFTLPLEPPVGRSSDRVK